MSGIGMILAPALCASILIALAWILDPHKEGKAGAAAPYMDIFRLFLICCAFFSLLYIAKGGTDSFKDCRWGINSTATDTTLNTTANTWSYYCNTVTDAESGYSIFIMRIMRFAALAGCLAFIVWALRFLADSAKGVR